MAISGPLSEVAICNMANTHLKQEFITSIDPPSSTPEKIYALWYAQTKQSMLRSHPWNFAIKRTTITPDTSAVPVFGFTHSYLLPTDFVRYLTRHDDIGTTISASADDLNDYQIEGDHILLNGADATAIKIRYIFDTTEIAKWDPLFIDAFALALAINVAPNFSASEARVRELKQLFQETMARATAIDGQERPPTRREHSKFIQARRTNPTVASSFTKFD